MIKIPSSKSILQRLLLLLAHSRKDIVIHNFNPCQDVLELQKALEIFGYEVQESADARKFHFSDAKHQSSAHHYHFEASATAYRLFMPFLANQAGIQSCLTASQTLFQRGISPLLEALGGLGAQYSVQENSILFQSKALQGNTISIDTNLSSQFASAFVLAAPFINGQLRLNLNGEKVSLPYLKLSVQMLNSFGAKFLEKDSSLEITNKGVSLPADFTVDTDLSTAAFYAVKAALGDSPQSLQIHQNPAYPQADSAIWKILETMGIKIEKNGEQYRIFPAPPVGIRLCLKDTPDLMPVLSVMALFCRGETHLSQIGRLIHKESDRVRGICRAFDLLGANYQLQDGCLKIWQLQKTPPAVILDTQNDHRLVMAFSLLLRRFPHLQISEWQSIKKSIPNANFADLLK